MALQINPFFLLAGILGITWLVLALAYFFLGWGVILGLLVLLGIGVSVGSMVWFVMAAQREGATWWSWWGGILGQMIINSSAEPQRYGKPVLTFALGVGMLLALIPLNQLSGGIRTVTGSGPSMAQARGAQAMPATRKVDEGPPPIKRLFVGKAVEYLSDLDEFAVLDGPWPFAKNGSLGNSKDNIVVQGIHSPKGLGMHPPSSSYSAVRFRLGKQGALFKSSVAIDDTGGGAFGGAEFEVLGDGKQLWRSAPVARSNQPPLDCRIELPNVDILELRVYSPQVHNGLHAVWVEPRVFQKLSTPDPSVPPAKESQNIADVLKVLDVSKIAVAPRNVDVPKAVDMPKGPATQKSSESPRVADVTKLPKPPVDLAQSTYLSDMDEFDVKAGPWTLGKNGDIGNGQQIVVNGNRSSKGLGMHPPDNGYSRVKYRLGKKAAVFKAGAALNDTANIVFHLATFEVWGDGKRLWKSDPVSKAKQPVQETSVDVSGVDVLELRVVAHGSHLGLHAVWIEPRVLKNAEKE